MRPSLSPFALSLSLTLGVACAPMAARTSGAVVTGGLDALQGDENQAALRALLQDPAVADAARRLAEASVTGALDGLDDEERAAVLHRRAEAFVAALSPRLAASLRAELGPALRAELTAAVADAVGALAKDPARSDLVSLAKALSAAVTDTLVSRTLAQTGRGLETQLGPASAVVLREQLGPALAEVLELQLMPVAQRTLPPLVGETVRVASGVFAQELNAALQGELGETLRADRAATFGQVDALLKAREDTASAWLTSLGLLSSVLGVAAAGLGWLWLRSRRESAARLASVELVTGVIKQRSATDPGAVELAREVKRASVDTEAGRWLSGFLAEKRHLKIELPEE